MSGFLLKLLLRVPLPILVKFEAILQKRAIAPAQRPAFKKLRKKIQAVDPRAELIYSVYGVGYTYENDLNRASPL